MPGDIHRIKDAHKSLQREIASSKERAQRLCQYVIVSVLGYITLPHHYIDLLNLSTSVNNYH